MIELTFLVYCFPLKFHEQLNTIKELKSQLVLGNTNKAKIRTKSEQKENKNVKSQLVVGNTNKAKIRNKSEQKENKNADRKSVV